MTEKLSPADKSSCDRFLPSSVTDVLQKDDDAL